MKKQTLFAFSSWYIYVLHNTLLYFCSKILLEKENQIRLGVVLILFFLRLNEPYQ